VSSLSVHFQRHRDWAKPLTGPDQQSRGLGFALLRGGSRISHHRAGVLSLEGCPFVHSVLTPLTVPASGLPGPQAACRNSQAQLVKLSAHCCRKTTNKVTG
jgi:hypothetical protein